MAGLASALRLAMFGKSVLLLEKHYVVGGLNSFFARGGRKFDVGLHAVTNFPPNDSAKASPLIRLCRQLRIPFEELALSPKFLEDRLSGRRSEIQQRVRLFYFRSGTPIPPRTRSFSKAPPDDGGFRCILA